jgi:hypothetical protein
VLVIRAFLFLPVVVEVFILGRLAAIVFLQRLAGAGGRLHGLRYLPGLRHLRGLRRRNRLDWKHRLANGRCLDDFHYLRCDRLRLRRATLLTLRAGSDEYDCHDSGECHGDNDCEPSRHCHPPLLQQASILCS